MYRTAFTPPPKKKLYIGLRSGALVEDAGTVRRTVRRVVAQVHRGVRDVRATDGGPCGGHRGGGGVGAEAVLGKVGVAQGLRGR